MVSQGPVEDADGEIILNPVIDNETPIIERLAYDHEEAVVKQFFVRRACQNFDSRFARKTPLAIRSRDHLKYCKGSFSRGDE